MPGGPLSQESDVRIFCSPKERLDFYRREIHYETGQLSSRTNAYLTAQSFLVIAYASSMANLNPAWGELFTLVVPALLALLGIVNSLHAWPGIQASSEIICHWQFKQSCLLHSDPEIGLAYDDSPLFSEREVNAAASRKPCCSRDACRSCSPASGVRWACFRSGCNWPVSAGGPSLRQGLALAEACRLDRRAPSDPGTPGVRALPARRDRCRGGARPGREAGRSRHGCRPGSRLGSRTPGRRKEERTGTGRYVAVCSWCFLRKRLEGAGAAPGDSSAMRGRGGADLHA